MKGTIVAAFCAAQLLAAQPAAAAELIGNPGATAPQRGAFAGARLRLPIGGTREKAHAGLTLTGIERSRSTGENRFSEGFEAGFARGGEFRLAMGGRPLEAPQGQRKAGVSTLGWVAIGVGTAVVVGALGFGLWLDERLEDANEEE